MEDRSKYWKYPRTPHLHFSGGATEDDRTWSEQDLQASAIANADEIVVTEKIDGEAFSGYRDYCHARSLDSRHHLSRDWVKRRWNEVKHNLPEGYRVCGENAFAKHTIFYDDLPSYLLVFSIWNDNNEALNWDETLEWIQLLGLHCVPVLYRGPYDEQRLRDMADGLDPEEQEGYVVRTAEGFHYDDFQSHVAKFVTAEFKEKLKNTSEHWMHQQIVPNELKESDNE